MTAASDALQVNWVELTITHADNADNADNAAVLYHNTWITNHLATHDTAPQIADAGRARWKNENESHNILKKHGYHGYHGYHIDHNFGHGDHNLAAVLFTLNVLAFLTHTVQQLIDTPYQLLRAARKTRQTFFESGPLRGHDLRALLCYQRIFSKKRGNHGASALAARFMRTWARGGMAQPLKRAARPRRATLTLSLAIRS